MNSIVWDTETTGLVGPMNKAIDRQPEIIQVHAELIAGGEIVDTFSTFVKPQASIPDEVIKITSITDEMVSDAPRWKDVAVSFQEFVRGATEIVAHNLTFDMDMVDLESRRLGVEFVWPMHKVCTAEATEHIAGRRMKLIDLHEHLFGERFEDAHLAQNDVAALRRCFVELRERGEV